VKYPLHKCCTTVALQLTENGAGILRVATHKTDKSDVKLAAM
jgi:hypothetical protein